MGKRRTRGGRRRHQRRLDAVPYKQLAATLRRMSQPQPPSDVSLALGINVSDKTLRKWYRWHRQGTLVRDGIRFRHTGARVGRPPRVWPVEERAAAEWAMDMARKGHAQDEYVLLAHLSHAVDQQLDMRWLTGFYRRHPKVHGVVRRMVETKYAVGGKPKQVAEFARSFSDVDDIARARGVPVVDINVDETGVSIVVVNGGRKGKVVAVTGEKKTNRVSGAADKTAGEHCTLVASVSNDQALNDMLLLGFVFSKKADPRDLFKPFADGTRELRRAYRHVNKSGWMNGELWTQFMDKLIDAVREWRKLIDPSNVPVVRLTFDCASSHGPYDVFLRLADADIHCVPIPELGTSKLQMLDTKLFLPFKNDLRRRLRGLVAEYGQPAAKLPWYAIVQAARAAWSNTATTARIAEVFAENRVAATKSPSGRNVDDAAAASTSGGTDVPSRTDYDLRAMQSAVDASGDGARGMLQSMLGDDKRLQAPLQLFWDLNRSTLAPFVLDMLREVEDAGLSLPVPTFDPQDVDVLSKLTPISKSARRLFPVDLSTVQKREKAIDAIGGKLMSREDTLAAYRADAEAKEAKERHIAAGRVDRAEIKKLRAAQEEERLTRQHAIAEEYTRSIDAGYKCDRPLSMQQLRRVASVVHMSERPKRNVDLEGKLLERILRPRRK